MPRTGVILAALLCAAAPCAAQISPQPRLDGRDFDGLLVDAPLQALNASLSGSRVTAWEEGTTRRLLMDTDAEVAIGPYRFRARRCVAWIERVRLPDDAGDATQIALYFDEVRTPGAAPAVSQSGDRLLVTALVSGDVSISADVFERGRAYGPFVGDAEYRLSQRLAQIASGDPTFVASALDSGDWRPPPAYRLDLIDTPGADAANPDQAAPAIPQQAVVTFHGPDRTLVTGDDENALVISGGVAVQFEDVANGQRLHLSSDSAVVFLEPRELDRIDGFTPDDVRGVYLEGGVIATDGDYTMRGPRMYYDLSANTGVILDAVFWTYDSQRELPLYLRADVIRQEADNRWAAENARFANVEFFEPHFAIGATSVALTRRPRSDGSSAFSIDAEGVGYQVNGGPAIPLPRFKGELDGSRAPRVSFRTRDGNPIVYTRWNLYGLLGLEQPDGVTTDLLLDGYFERGGALGLDARWNTLENDGSFFAYYFRDDGVDNLGSGFEINRDNADRGTILGENRWDINSDWTLFTEVATVSDPAFFDAIFPDIADTRRELRTGAYLRRQRDHDVFALDVSGTLDDYVVNEYLLQSRGYQVARLPEALYDRVDLQLFGAPITHFGQTRIGMVEARLSTENAIEYGLDTPERSLRGIGTLPNQSPSDVLTTLGFPQREIARFDTRHELSAPLRAGAWTITPRAVGRITAYDDDFAEYSPNEDDHYRVWGGVGADLTTSFVRVNNLVDSSLWDLHRMRHIIEPTVSFWWADASVESQDLPVFDEQVEALNEGSLFRLGLRNTWQTKRGGLGALRSVDWLTLDVNYVKSSDDAPRSSSLGRVFNDRPELGTYGEFFQADATMWLTDAVALTGFSVYDIEDTSGTYASAGFFIDHGVGFSTYADLRYLDVIDSTLLHAGASYRLTSKYAVDGAVLYDFEDEEFQSTSAAISRRFPQWTVRLGLTYDDLRDDLGASVVLRPIGLKPYDQRRLAIFPEERDYRAPESSPLAAPRRFGG